MQPLECKLQSNRHLTFTARRSSLLRSARQPAARTDIIISSLGHLVPKIIMTMTKQPLLIACFLALKLMTVIADSVTVQLDKSSELPVQPVRPNFAGVSLEVHCLPEQLGAYPNKPRVSYTNLLQNLQRQSGLEGPIIRIGGNSADESVYNPNSLAVPNNTRYNISAMDLKSYEQFGKEFDVAFVIDTNFAVANSAKWGVAHIQGVAQVMEWNRIKAVEIGNECDLFFENGLRPTSFNYEEYKQQFDLYRDAYLAAGMPSKRIQGGTFCCSHFDSHVADYIMEEKSQLKTFSYHKYPTSTCNGGVATMKELLSAKATSGTVQRDLAQFAKDSAAAGIDFYLGESNSASCGGEKGVSNALGSALWGVDWMFNLAAVNTSGVNFHGCPVSTYTPIGLKDADKDIADVRPLYYAMWLFSEATANHARILSVPVTTTNDAIVVWAVVGPDGRKRVTIIHKDPWATLDAKVHLETGAACGSNAQAFVLSAAGGVTAEYGVTYAGQTYDNTPDGNPIGTRQPVNVPCSSGVYEIHVEPATAVLVKF